MNSEFADVEQIIVALIAIAGVVYSLRQPKEFPRPSGKTGVEKALPHVLKRPRSQGIVMWVSISLLVINLGVFGLRIWPGTKVKITYPSDGASVELREVIRGTSQRIHVGEGIWIIIYPQAAGRYYPYDSPPDTQADGKWASSANVGMYIERGMRFDIIAVVANTKAQDEFNAYHTQARAVQSRVGLGKLPDGAVIYDRLTVMRKRT